MPFVQNQSCEFNVIPPRLKEAWESSSGNELEPQKKICGLLKKVKSVVEIRNRDGFHKERIFFSEIIAIFSQSFASGALSFLG